MLGKLIPPTREGNVRIVNAPLVLARLLVAMVVCAGIFVATLLSGLWRIPQDVFVYSLNDAVISWRNVNVNFPRLKKEGTSKKPRTFDGVVK